MRKCRPLLLVASMLSLAAFPAAAQSEWQSEARCRLAADGMPAAYARCGTLEVPLDPAAPEKALIGGTEPFTVTPYLFEWFAGLVVTLVAAAMMFRGSNFKRKGK